MIVLGKHRGQARSRCSVAPKRAAVPVGQLFWASHCLSALAKALMDDAELGMTD